MVENELENKVEIKVENKVEEVNKPNKKNKQVYVVLSYVLVFLMGFGTMGLINNNDPMEEEVKNAVGEDHYKDVVEIRETGKKTYIFSNGEGITDEIDSVTTDLAWE